MAVEMLANYTLEGVPLSGTWESKNAIVKVGGLAVMRVSDFRVTMEDTILRYEEVGSAEAIPYSTHKRIRGSLNRAYINAAMWRMAVGLKADKQSYGVVNTINNASNEKDLLATLSEFNQPDGSILIKSGGDVYPIKTVIEAEINKNNVLRGNYSGALLGSSAKIYLIILDAMIDVSTLNINPRGLITETMSFRGEHAFWKVEIV